MSKKASLGQGKFLARLYSKMTVPQLVERLAEVQEELKTSLVPALKLEIVGLIKQELNSRKSAV